MLALLCPALAATLTVEADGSGSVATLADAAAIAAAGDTIVLGDGTFLGATFPVRVSLQSRNGSGATTIDGLGVAPLVGNAGLDVRGVTLTSSGTAAVSIVGGGSLEDVVVRDSGSYGASYGGAVLGNGEFTIDSSRFQDNQAYVGAGIYAYGTGSVLTLNDVEFSGNSAYYGAGIYLDSQVTAIQSEVVYTANVAYYHGGGIYAGYFNPVVSTDVVYSDNAAPNGWGGSAYVGTSSSYDAATETHTGNSAQYGGALSLYYATATLSGGRYEDNVASLDGGANHFYVVTGSESGAVYVGNTTTGGNGGAVHANAGTLSFEEPTFTANTAEVYHGGAVSLTNYAAATLVGGSFTGNEALAYGGGVYATSYASVTLDGATLDANAANYGGGGYVETGSTLNTTDTVWSNNYAETGGGAVYAYNYASVDEAGASYTDNSTYGTGGGIYSYLGVSLREAGGTFADGTAIYGYGGHVYAYYYGSAEFDDCVFSTGLAYYDAGAIYAYALYDGPLVLRDTTITGNTSTYGSGGGALIGYVPSATLDHLTVTDNQSYSYGGGLVMYGQGGTTVDASTIQYNTATTYSGGGIHWDGGYPSSADFRVRDSVIADNAAGESGGGLYVAWPDELEVSRTTLTGNVAGNEAFGGGLIARNTTGTLRVDNSVFQSNSAGYGGGAYIEGVEALDVPNRWTNTVFATNQAAVGGAACFVYAIAHELINATVVGNAASEAAGGFCVVQTGLSLDNTVIAYTAAGAALHVYDEPSAARLEFEHGNLYGNVAGDAGGSLGATPASLAAEPGFAGWWDDGHDNDSFVLAGTSPMIDAGNPSLTDRDGSRSDIGAYGGPDVHAVDEDADGYESDRDCDDVDATVHPGATDAWYDGVDADCLGNDDDDQDQDGAPVDEDCDDTDPAVVDPCDSGEPAPDSGDTDTDGEPSPSPDCGCASNGSPERLLAGAILAGLVLARRRRA